MSFFYEFGSLFSNLLIFLANMSRHKNHALVSDVPYVYSIDCMDPP